MKLTIEDQDKDTLIEALHAQIRFWFIGRNKTHVWLREWARSETRAAIRLLRAVKGAK
jgi:hypothetical protein